MAGDWLKIEANTPDKPEVIGIADILSMPPAHAFGCLFMIWRWFDQHTTEGNAMYVTKVTIDRLSGVTGFADAMQKVGWLVINEDGSITLPNFGRHNGETAKQRGLTAKRVAKSKAKTASLSNAQGNAQVTDGALPREEKRREEVNHHQDKRASTDLGASTSAGRVCARLRAAGITGVNPSRPDLRELLESGVPEDEITGVGEEPTSRGKGLAWVIATVVGRRKDAANLVIAPGHPEKPKKACCHPDCDAPIAGEVMGRPWCREHRDYAMDNANFRKPRVAA